MSLPALKAPTSVLHPQSRPAGYDAASLDGALRSYIAVAEKNIRHAESLGKKVDEALKNLEELTLAGGADALEEANKLTTLYDRTSKAGLQLVKALDELTRLRSFLAGGPDSRPDLTLKGEIELRAVVLTAVKQLGLTVVDK